MAIAERLTPTLFDKLVADLQISGLTNQSGKGEADALPAVVRENFRFYSVPNLERFNERALKDTVKRELGWLLNTTQFAATTDLEPYPEVATSVLNYGVPDLAGRTLTHRVILQRAREIRRAIQLFEARIDADSLRVEPTANEDGSHQVIFVIEGDITNATRAFPAQFRTKVDAEIAAVEVHD